MILYVWEIENLNSKILKDNFKFKKIIFNASLNCKIVLNDKEFKTFLFSHIVIHIYL